MDKRQNKPVRPGYRRITEIIRPFSGVEMVPQEILKVAAVRGTRTHEVIEDILSGDEPATIDDDVKPYIASFRQFWSKSGHIFQDSEILLEERLYCDRHMITGQVDLIAKTKDRTYAIDWKTSSAFHISFWSQGAAYKYMMMENGFENVDEVLFVRLNKYGKAPTLHKSNDFERDIGIFFKCLELYDYFNMENTRIWK